jgi:RHS repeat-associated protein
MEPLVATTQYPYSRVEYSTTQPGMVRRSAIAGDEYRMGSGHESQSYTIAVNSDELFRVYGYNGWTINRLVDEIDEEISVLDTISFNEDQYCYKTISINPDGRQQVTYSGTDGLMIASCIAGTGTGDVVEAESAIEPWADYIDIHLPEGCQSSLKVDLKLGGSIDIIDLATDEMVKENIYLDMANAFEGGVLEIIYLSVVDASDPTSYTLLFDDSGHSGYNFILNSYADGDNMYLKHAWVLIDDLTPGIYRIYYNRGDADLGGRAVVKYNLNYSNYALNYYDEQGRIKETISPAGVADDFDPIPELVADNDIVGTSFNQIISAEISAPIPSNNSDKLQYNEISVSSKMVVDNIILWPIEQINPVTKRLTEGIAVPVGYINNEPVYREVTKIAAVDAGGSVGIASDVLTINTWIANEDGYEKVAIDNLNQLLSLETGDTLGLFTQTRSSMQPGDAVGETETRRLLGKTGSIIASGPVSSERISVAQTLNIYEDYDVTSYQSFTNKSFVSNSSGGTYPDSWELDPIDHILPDDYPDGTGSGQGGAYNYYNQYYKIIYDLVGVYSSGSGTVNKTIKSDQELICSVSGCTNCGDNYPVTFSTNNRKLLIDPSDGEGLTMVKINTKQITNIYGTPDPYIPDDLQITLKANVKTFRVDKTPGHTMKDSYTYNVKGRLESKTTPDAGKTEYVYRTDGRLRFSRDARQQAEGKFSYVKYDRTGRTIESGEYNDNAGPLDFSATMDGDMLNSDINTAYCSEENFIMYDCVDNNFETQSGFDADDYKQRFLTGRVSKTWNDNVITWYSYDEAGRPEWVVRHYNGMGSTTADGTRSIRYEYGFDGRVNNIVYQQDETDEFVHGYVYDADGRLSVVSTTPYGASADEQAEYKYYLHGALKRTEIAGNLQGIDYIYTVNGMLKSINHPDLDATVNGTPVDPGKDGYGTSNFKKDIFGETIDYYAGDYKRAGTFVNSGNPMGDVLYNGTNSTGSYNGNIKAVRWQLAGQVTETTLPDNSHWANYYTYDELNRITEAAFGTYKNDNTVNANQATTANVFATLSSQAVANRLMASGTEGKTIREIYTEALDIAKEMVAGSGSSASWYNGLLCEAEETEGENTEEPTDDVVISLDGTCSNINTVLSEAVLMLGIDQAETTTTQSTNYFTPSPVQEYRMWDISYDLNGNILTMKRNGYNLGTLQSPDVDMDNLAYSYYTNSNRLKTVDDIVGSSGFGTDITDQGADNYSYNTSGWQTGNTDESKYFTYNRFGMATGYYSDAQHAVQEAGYNYDEGGFRIKKTDYSGAEDETTWYIRDVQGNIISTYTQTGTGSPTQAELPVYGLSRVGMYQAAGSRYVWELTDHLGNLRALITEDGVDADKEPDLLSYKDYYPFGMEMPGRSLNPSDYRFAYQGLYAEADAETGLSSFWLRNYDARIGQFTTTDPFNYGFSSYNGMDNNPVSFVDPTGGYPEWVHWVLRQFGIIKVHVDKGDRRRKSDEVGGVGGSPYSNVTFSYAPSGSQFPGNSNSGSHYYGGGGNSSGGNSNDDTGYNYSYYGMSYHDPLQKLTQSADNMVMKEDDGGKPDGDKTKKPKNSNLYSGFSFSSTVVSRQLDIYKYAAKGNLPKAYKGINFAGNVVSVISIVGDVLYLSNNMQNMSYGEIQKVQVDITSNALTLFPQTAPAGIIMNIVDMTGGFDWMYNNANRLQQAGYPYSTTNPVNNPTFIWINQP